MKHLFFIFILAASFGCKKDVRINKTNSEITTEVNSKSGDFIYQPIEEILVNEEISINGFSLAPIPCKVMMADETKEYLYYVEGNICPSHELVIEISICGMPYSVKQLSILDTPNSIPISVPCGCDLTIQMYTVDMNNGIKCKTFGSATGTLYLTN